jgi:hypothetical protein
MRPAHAPKSMRLNHGIACVNPMERIIASSAQRAQILPMTLVRRQSWWGLTCINGFQRTPGWVISGPQSLTSWTVEKMSRLAAIAPLGEGIAQQVIVI